MPEGKNQKNIHSGFALSLPASPVGLPLSNFSRKLKVVGHFEWTH
jgi:hypothetical protein